MRCLKCFRSEKGCLCSEVQSFNTHTRFVILMHPMEFKREKNGTGHLSSLILKNSEIITGIDFTDNKLVNDYLNNEQYQCFLLYPGEKSINISIENPNKYFIKNKQVVLFIIDGTWPHAKKMMRLSHNLHELPRISFDSKIESRFFIKQQPSEFCLSTIESIYQVISEFEKYQLENSENQKEHLLSIFQKMIDFQVKCSLDPTLESYKRGNENKKKGFTPMSERKKSKKWKSYSIIYKD